MFIRERKRRPTNGHVEPTALELSVLLAHRAWLATAVNNAITAWALLQQVLSSHFRPVEAGIQARTARRTQ